jgi:hypothetical protein
VWSERSLHCERPFSVTTSLAKSKSGSGLLEIAGRWPSKLTCLEGFKDGMIDWVRDK